MPVVSVAAFETRSRVCLDETNVYKYASHPSTEVLSSRWSIRDDENDDGDIGVWRRGDPYPFAHCGDGIIIESFNGEFELTIWNCCCAKKYGWPLLKPSQISCLQ